MVNVNHYMWIYTEEQSLYIYHTPTMQNIALIQLRNNKSSLIEMVHVPQWNVVVALWNRSQLWCLHDQVSASGLHVVDTIELNSKNPIIHLCTVDLPHRTEVWATREKEIVIIKYSADGVSCESTLPYDTDINLQFCYFITCLHFISSKTGNNTVHVWVSFNRRPHLVCWDAESRVQINSIIKKGVSVLNCIYSHFINDACSLGSTDNVASLLGHGSQLYVGTFQGYVEVYDSEGGTLLRQFSVHAGRVCKMLKLPEEVYQCVCPELLMITNDEIVRTESIDLSDASVTPRKRSLQERTLQQNSPVVNGELYPFTSKFKPSQSIKTPLIITLGSGTANWLDTESTEVSVQPHLLTWSGHGDI